MSRISIDLSEVSAQDLASAYVVEIVLPNDIPAIAAARLALVFGGLLLPTDEGANPVILVEAWKIREDAAEPISFRQHLDAVSAMRSEMGLSIAERGTPDKQMQQLHQLFDLAFSRHMSQRHQAAFIKEAKRRGLLSHEQPVN